MKSVPQAAFLIGELVFTTSRSSGPGGQNVNKVNSKVTLRFDVVNSALLSAKEKDIILKKLATKITNEGVLVLNAQESRSQLQNKEDVMVNFDRLLKKAFEKKKARKKTKPSKSAVAKRIKGKKQTSEKKKWRQKPI
jgi:ribosome-associated protein